MTRNPYGTRLDGRHRHPRRSYDIFEGTEQIQQLVVARAISGLRIE
jgi:alkylation response protein AidB-like acyl-CoA dehydrogenase